MLSLIRLTIYVHLLIIIMSKRRFARYKILLKFFPILSTRYIPITIPISRMQQNIRQCVINVHLCNVLLQQHDA